MEYLCIAQKSRLLFARWIRLVLVAIMLTSAYGQTASANDISLNQLHDSFLPLRALAKQGTDLDPARDGDSLRRAVPLLRDWLDAQISKVDPALVKPIELGKQLNEQLAQADLLCDATRSGKVETCGPVDAFERENDAGYLEPLRVDDPLNDGITVVVPFAVTCGSREAVYRYEYLNGRWKRVLTDERNFDAADFSFTPLDVNSVPVSDADQATGDRLALVLGSSAWCSSTWHTIYYRLYQLPGSGSKPLLLLDKTEEANTLDKEVPIKGSVGPHDAAVEYIGPSSIEAGERYDTIRHYEVSGCKVRRIDPLALNPRNFILEWNHASAAEAAAWQSNPKNARLKAWHRLYENGSFGEFDGNTRHCTGHADQWQVAIDFGTGGDAKGDEYFLVRWKPPYRFQLIDARTRPWPDCQVADPTADEERSLFWDQDWR